MWTILGIIVLAMVCMTIQIIVSETVENKRKVFFLGYCLGVIVVIIFVTRFIKPKLNEYETKVNKLTTELYESYNVRDSLEQELVSDVLKEDKK